MDTLDTKIFREMVQDRDAFATSDLRKSFKVIARKLNIDEVTIRKRLVKMERSGFLQGWTVMVNPTLLGLEVAQMSIVVPSRINKHELIDQLKLLPGSLVLVDCFGSSLFFSFLYRDEHSLERQVELVGIMSKATNLVYQQTPVPESTAELTEVDWMIVRSLQKNPRKSYGIIAMELGVSSRTVKRRLKRMIDDRAVFIIPRMNPAALEGLIQADLLVFYENPKSKAEVDTKIMALWDDYLARAEVGDRDSSFFNLFVKNISQAQEVVDWVHEQPGVRSSRIDLVQDRFELYSSINAELDRRIRKEG